MIEIKQRDSVADTPKPMSYSFSQDQHEIPKEKKKSGLAAMFSKNKEKVQATYTLTLLTLIGPSIPISTWRSFIVSYRRGDKKKNQGMTDQIATDGPDALIGNDNIYSIGINQDVGPFNCSLIRDKKTKSFESKNIAFSIVPDSDNGKKKSEKAYTMAVLDLAEFAEKSGQTHTISFPKAHITLQVRFDVKWVKVGNKRLVEPEGEFSGGQRIRVNGEEMCLKTEVGSTNDFSETSVADVGNDSDDEEIDFEEENLKDNPVRAKESSPKSAASKMVESKKSKSDSPYSSPREIPVVNNGVKIAEAKRNAPPPIQAKITSVAFNPAPAPEKISAEKLADIIRPTLYGIFLPIEERLDDQNTATPQIQLGCLRDAFKLSDQLQDDIVNGILETCNYEFVVVQLMFQAEGLSKHHFYSAESFGDSAKFARWRDLESKRINAIIQHIYRKNPGLQLSVQPSTSQGAPKFRPMDLSFSHSVYHELFKYIFYHHYFSNKNTTSELTYVPDVASLDHDDLREVCPRVLFDAAMTVFQEYCIRYQIGHPYAHIMVLDVVSKYFDGSVPMIVNIWFTLKRLYFLLRNKGEILTQKEIQILSELLPKVKENLESSIASIFPILSEAARSSQSAEGRAPSNVDHQKLMEVATDGLIVLQAMYNLCWGNQCVSPFDLISPSLSRGIEIHFNRTMESIDKKSDIFPESSDQWLNKLACYIEDILLLEIGGASLYEPAFKQKLDIVELCISVYYKLIFKEVIAWGTYPEKRTINDMYALCLLLSRIDSAFHKKFPDRTKPETPMKKIATEFLEAHAEKLAQSVQDESSTACNDEKWFSISPEEGHKFSSSAVDLSGMMSEVTADMKRMEGLFPARSRNTPNIALIISNKVVGPSVVDYLKKMTLCYIKELPILLCKDPSWENNRVFFIRDLPKEVKEFNPNEKYEWEEIYLLKACAWKEQTPDEIAEFIDKCCVQMNNIEYLEKDVKMSWKIEDNPGLYSAISQARSILIQLLVCWFNVKANIELEYYIKHKKDRKGKTKRKDLEKLFTMLEIQIGYIKDSLLDEVFPQVLPKMWDALIFDIKSAAYSEGKVGSSALQRAKQAYVDLKQILKDHDKNTVNFGGIEREMAAWFEETEKKTKK
eukprot:TRINITY_DN859_c0_g1_i2.p1 TRINITY_DN859_c0_g1~~TRINITY_DN859_c0_g1_i2.p1  ORF type:complete len:1159 (+),score=406.58 TRINITY_DN859_c0_g1_i2:97-3477(+)